MRFIPGAVNNLPYKARGSYSSISTTIQFRKPSNKTKHNILHRSMLNRVIHSRRLRENGFYKARRNEVGGCGKLVVSSYASVSSKNAPNSVKNHNLLGRFKLQVQHYAHLKFNIFAWEASSYSLMFRSLLRKKKCYYCNHHHL